MDCFVYTFAYLVLCAFASLLCLPNSFAQYQPNWDSLDKRPLPTWYDESKIGVFVSWGLFSVPSFGNEWFWYRWKENTPEYVQFMQKSYPPGFTYEDFVPMFTAELYDPTHWADVIAKSGARYVVYITKHHDGFCNWPTNTSWNWNSFDVGPHRDLTGEFADAIKQTNSVHFGVYFSQFEWFNPLFLADQANNFTTNTYVKEVSQPQLYELVRNYKPDIIFSDGDWSASDVYFNSTQFLAWLYNSSPVKENIVVNDRWGKGCSCTHGGYFNCKDRYNPKKLQNHKWENAMTIDRKSWGFRREAPIGDYLTPEELISDLVITISCGGNFLVNIGPSKDGRIGNIYEERLLQMGEWLAINGDSVYSSKPWQHQNDTVNSQVWYTHNPSSKMVYATTLSYPSDYILTIGAIKPASSTKVNLLGYGDVKWSYQDLQMKITMPYLPLDSKLQWAWTLSFADVTPFSSERYESSPNQL